MAGFWLSSLAWTIAAGKLVLLATLWLRHGHAAAPSDLLALVPEIGLAAALTLAGRITPHAAPRALLSLLAGALAVLSWLALAPWAFAGAPVGFDLLRRLGLDSATLRTALADPSLRVQFLGWLGGLLLVWAGVATTLLLLRRAAHAVSDRAANALLLACVAAAVALAATRPAAPERRLGLAVALVGDGATIDDAKAVDPAAAAELAAPARRTPPDAASAAAATRIRNVLIVVLESVRREPGSRFVDGFREAIHFDRAYAHHPRSVKTLEALLFGIYPSPGLLSAAWAIDLYDVDAIGTLPRVLAAHGFANHYFSAMQLGFDNYGGTLAAAGFADVEVVHGGQALTWGAAAPVLFDRVATTLEQGSASGVRQLVMAWTAECHLPYDYDGERVVEGDPRARYRSCQDALAGDVAELLDRLRRDGILEQTLVVVLGDHGQIFASEKAGEFGHGSHVYEQSLRIPLLLFVPGAAARRDDRLVQPVDVPATILSALGMPIPTTWVGRDLLDPAQRGRAFVVALSTLSDGQAAVIDAAGEKLVQPSSSDGPTSFDLTRDPNEEHGAPAGDGAARTGEARIATYAQLASRGWSSHRLDATADALAFDGHALATRWAAGPCVTTQLTADGDLRLEPAAGGSCAPASDPFERRLGRAFAQQALAAGFALRLTLDVDESALDPAHPPRALVKIWGRDETFSVPLDPHAHGFQTVTSALPGPSVTDASGETMIAVVGVDPAAPYLLRSIELSASPSPGAAGDGKH